MVSVTSNETSSDSENWYGASSKLSVSVVLDGRNSDASETLRSTVPLSPMTNGMSAL